MIVDEYSFGRIVIDGKEYTKDIVIHDGTIEKRDKKKSKHLKSQYGHTPLTPEENIPWNHKRLIVGTGAYGKLPVVRGVKDEARKKMVKLEIMPTKKALTHLNDADTNMILHLTC
jgi:hypothetical protein